MEIGGAALPGVLALGLACYQLSLPHVLFGVNGYDEGVYFGSAVRLVHGLLPYRDFVFEHPPGMPLLMAPIAAIGRMVGTRDAMAVARCLTAVVVAVNAGLAGLSLRHRGLAAMLTAGLALALFPDAVGGDSTVLLGPYVVFFCLVGVVVTFDHGGLAGRRRLLIGGLAFGFAGTVKVWALFPVIAAVVCMFPRWRDGIRPFLSGLALGFGIPTLPFFLLARHAFAHEVVIDQLTRHASSVNAFSPTHRLLLITGLHGLLGDRASPAVVTGVAVGGAVLAISTFVAMPRMMNRMEWFALTAAALVLVALIVLSPEFVEQYAYFSAPFVALLAGACVYALVGALAPAAAGAARSSLLTLGCALGALLVIGLLARDVSYARSDLAVAFDPSRAVAATIPDGACVVFDTPAVLIMANRITPHRPGCPPLVDPYGVALSFDPAHPPPRRGRYEARPGFVELWRRWLKRADYVVQVAPQSDFLPWPRSQLAWFHANYRLVSPEPGAFVYAHR